MSVVAVSRVVPCSRKRLPAATAGKNFHVLWRLTLSLELFGGRTLAIMLFQAVCFQVLFVSERGFASVASKRNRVFQACGVFAVLPQNMAQQVPKPANRFSAFRERADLGCVAVHDVLQITVNRFHELISDLGVVRFVVRTDILT